MADFSTILDPNNSSLNIYCNQIYQNGKAIPSGNDILEYQESIQVPPVNTFNEPPCVIQNNGDFTTKGDIISSFNSQQHSLNKLAQQVEQIITVLKNLTDIQIQ